MRDPDREPFEIIWLPEDCTIESAFELIGDNPASFGLAEKGTAGRLAVRFGAIEEASCFAKLHHLEDSSIHVGKSLCCQVQLVYTALLSCSTTSIGKRSASYIFKTAISG